MSGKDSTSGQNNNNVVPYDYGNKKADSGKVPKFNGDPEEFSWWKTNFYSYIMGLDKRTVGYSWRWCWWLGPWWKELLLIERNILLLRRNSTRSITRSEDHLLRLYLKQSIWKWVTISTTKAMFASLCVNYEDSKKVREAKSLMLVHQYELSKMKDDESIEQMYSRFQTLVSGLHILKKSYVASDHVSKIRRSLPARWRPKVTAI